MEKKAVIIGAGQIGRGFLGQILGDAGYRLVFVDSAKQLVDQINAQGSYKVIVVGADEVAHAISNICAYTPADEAAVREMADAQVVLTAVGPTVLEKTADYIAAGIAQRHRLGVCEPLTVIACENMEFGSSTLKRAVEARLSGAALAYCREMAGFPDAEVSRMVMPAADESPLTVKVEQYMELILDRAQVMSDLRGIMGIELADDPLPYIKRKMFTLTGHAMLGYYAYQAGYRYIYQAVYDDAIFKKVFGALAECGQGWSAEYAMPLQGFYEYITIMLRRFADTRLHDPRERICREPMRKLARNERFIGPALTALKHGVQPACIVDGIVCALKYADLGDPQAVELQRLQKTQGLGAVLQQVCGLRPDEALFGMIANRLA